MNLNDMAATLADAGTSIALTVLGLALVLSFPRIVDAIRKAIETVNTGDKQRSDTLAEMQKEAIKAGQDAFGRAIDVFVSRVNDLEREVREMRTESDRKDARIAEQATKIAEQAAEINTLKARVTELQRQLDSQNTGGSDGKKKRVTTKRSVADRAGL